MPEPETGQDSQPIQQSKVYHCRFGDCEFSTSNKSALPRHRMLHAANKEELKMKCLFCDKTALQASNLEDHMNTHGDLRPWKCAIEGCKFAANNRGHLSKHEIKEHGYRRKTNTFHPERVGQSRRRNPHRPTSQSTSSTGSDGSRRRGRHSPYTPPTTSSPVDSSPSPPGSLQDFDTSMIPGPTYSPQMFSHLQLFSESYIAPQTRMTGDPPNPWRLATPEAQTVQYAQQPMYQQGYHATALPAPLTGVSMNLSEDIFDDFLRRHGEYQPPDASPSAASSSAGNSPAFTPGIAHPHTLSDTRTTTPMASSENQNVASLRLPSYEHYGHSAGAASFNAQFTQPIATQNMDHYPQTFYSQTIYSQALDRQTLNQSFNYSYTAYPGTQGFNTN